MNLDIQQNRKDQKYTTKEQLCRVFWMAGKILFRLTPRPCFGFRRFILRCFGATVGKHVHIYSTTQIYFPWNLSIGDWSAIGEMALIYNLGPVNIGERATISHKAHVCAGTHDFKDVSLPLLKPSITIEDHAWVAAEAFLGPGVHIGEGAIVGARAVIFKDVDPWTVVGGNPARFIKKREVNE